jgi:hypothetical protein
MRILPSLALSVLLVAACGGHDGTGLFVPPPPGSGPSDGDAGPSGGSSGSSSGSSGASSGSSGASSGSSGSSGASSGSSGSSSGDPSCPYPAAIDHDADGYSANDGDCNDCDPAINPGAFDVPGNGKDDDCDGAKDEDAPCDGALGLTSADALDGAKAIGLCKKTTADAIGKLKTWGVLSARYVMPDRLPLVGHAESFGLLDKYGTTVPLEGARVLVLSSGAARAPGQPGYVAPSGYDKGYTHGTPSGYTARAPSGCTAITLGSPHDGVALEVTLRVPTNARSFTMNEDVFSYDYPQYVCSTFNDVFVVLEAPGPPGLSDTNIVFDSTRSPVSVDSVDLLQACAPQTAGGKTFPCTHGATTLNGTGFESHASTDWLTTRSPVTPGSTVTLLFAAWDSADGLLDTTVLIDGFTWSTTSVSAVSTSAK